MHRWGSLVVVTAGLLAGSGAMGCGKWADKLACGQDDCAWTAAEWERVASLAHIGDRAPPRDPSNEVLPTDEEWLAAHAPGGGAAALAIPAVELGWLLYHEPLLSGPLSNKDTLGRDAASPRPAVCGSVNLSCASCHDPRRYGGDFTSLPPNVSNGAGFYDVNIQQTLNASRFPILYWNGRADALWAQAAQVMESQVSMNGDRLNTLWVVATRYRARYGAVFKTAADALPAETDLTPASFPRHGKPGVAAYDALPEATRALATRVHANAAKAIGAYEWMIYSDDAPFDRFVTAGPASDLLEPAARRGLKLFVGRASCIDCHRTPLFSDGGFHNIGVPQVGAHVPTVAECTTKSCDCTDPKAAACLPSGAFGGLQKLKTQAFRRCTTDCPGADGSLPEARLLGAWRTPSLRDVAMTAPYMHDGAFATLVDVVWHYDQAEGGGGLGRSELSPLELSARNRDDLVAFLASLTGTPGPKELIDPPPGPSPDAGAPASCAATPDGGAGDAN